MLLYYITNRQHFAGSEAEQQEKLLAKIAEAASCGVDFIQLRERDLSARNLEILAEKALRAMRQAVGGVGIPPASQQSRASFPRLLINSRLDIALAIGADGVHLRSTDMPASEARAVAAKALHSDRARLGSGFFISVSGHTMAEVRQAEAHGADLVLFAPVFEKADGQGTPHGIKGLRAACRDRRAARPPVPILALGGVDIERAASCQTAGAAGVAGIRLFQEGDLSETVRKLRALE